MTKRLLQQTLCLFTLTLSSLAFAGTWTCELGLEDKMVYKTVFDGTDQGVASGSARVWVAGMGGAALTAVNEPVKEGELARLRIGQEDPRSNSVLRIQNEVVEPLVYKAGFALENNPLKKDFVGTCVYAP